MQKNIAFAAFAAIFSSLAFAAAPAPGNEANEAGAAASAPVVTGTSGAATPAAAEGARIRLFGRNGFMVDFFESSTCFGGDAKTSVSGTFGSTFASFLGKAKNVSLGMKDTPNTLSMAQKDAPFSKGYFREYKVAAGQPLTLRMSYSLPQGMSCGPIGAMFIPEAGKDYEAILDVNFSARRCQIVLQEVQERGAETVLAEVRRAPAKTCGRPVFVVGQDRTIQALRGTTVCHRESGKVGTEAAEHQLCVTQGHFQNDLYVYSFNQQALIHAFDDQTTNGVAGTYKATQISMTCTPQLSAPAEPTQEQLAALQALTPDATPEQVKLGYMRLNSTETGRQCEVRANNVPVYSVQVKFD
jgi:hypothetical protein